MAPPEAIEPARALGHPEHLGREPAHEGQLDLGGGGREPPPAEVRVQSRREQIGGRARHRARTGDVGHEPRMPDSSTVRRPRRAGRRRARRRPWARRERGSRRRRGPPSPSTGRTPAGRAGGRGAPARGRPSDRRTRARAPGPSRGRTGDGRSTVTVPSPRPAGTTRPSSLAGRCPRRTPSTMPPTWLSCSSIAWSFSSSRSGGSEESIESSSRRGDGRRPGPEDVEPVVDRHELVRPLLGVGRVVHRGARLADLGERAGGPLAHGHVRDVPGHAVGAEREDGVGLHLLHDRAHLRRSRRRAAACPCRCRARRASDAR